MPSNSYYQYCRYYHIFSELVDGEKFLFLPHGINQNVRLLEIRPGAKYIEKYSNPLQLLSLINDYNYNYITITGPVEM